MNTIRHLDPINTTVKASHKGEICEILCGSFRFAIPQLLGLWAQNVFKMNSIVDVLEGEPKFPTTLAFNEVGFS